MPRTPIMPVTVAEEGFHRPLFVTYLGNELRVEYIDQEWQDDAETWEHKPFARLYYQAPFFGDLRRWSAPDAIQEHGPRRMVYRGRMKMFTDDNTRM